LFVDNQVRYDTTGGKVHVGKPCFACKYVSEHIIRGELALAPGQVIPSKGFVRTDVKFGPSKSESPLIICGHVARYQLLESTLKGIHFREVTDWNWPRA
jgi:hypothetical protein